MRLELFLHNNRRPTGFGILLLFALSLLLLGGCATRRDTTIDARLARHPFHETRMRTEPTKGYIPTGVFRVEGKHNTVYLAGTCHIVPEKEVPFPSAFYASYGRAQEVYVETSTEDISLLTHPRLAWKVLRWAMAHRADLSPPKGKTLADYLSPETLAKIQEVSGKDLAQSRMTPLSFLLMQVTGGLEKGLPDGLDRTFELQARRDRKKVRHLDDSSITDTAMLIMEEALVSTKRDIATKGADAVVQEALTGASAQDARSWRFGDLKALEEEQQQLKQESAVTYEKGIVERNNKWMLKLHKILRKKQNVLVLVGAAHLPGKDGLLQSLTDAGYTVQQLYGVDRPE